MVRPSDDKSIPAAFGKDVPPNYYCRGRNVKRQKYCRNRAGARTDHVGIGRCWMHGGRAQNATAMKHGRRAKIATPDLRKAIEEALKDPDPLDMRSTLATAKGILQHAINTYGEKKSPVALADLNRSVDVVSKIALRIEHARGAVPVERVRDYVRNIREVIDRVVVDEKLREKLFKELSGLRP